ncbi:DUF1289 domain-containing protein [Variovorax sp. Sphag1AA]|uniref:DUF1289 domain-containing protein n=1 Tax=Variovorax sp. Sphag1AA TaxID=2587027 RepID=UPI0016208B62|nr:DUF1289 domain-containing protein [Variovorax sp. Sphag1AA]MBB3176996.1 hypothetical protein [Variovorax sp. Sphag1AA]
MTTEAVPSIVERAIAARAVESGVPSPCISICRISAESGFCEGCLRTIDEIAAWSRTSDADKRSVWRAIELRAQAGFLSGAEDKP